MLPPPDNPMVITRPHYIVGSDCGYCHDKKDDFTALPGLPAIANVPSKSSHITIGSQVEQMTCTHYDELINQGFRRSGNFLYKGDMLRGCCRMYTIRTDMAHLKVAKEHRQVVNRFKKAIAEEEVSQNKKFNRPFDLKSLIEAEQKSTEFHTRFESAKFSKEKFDLYKKYQVNVHNDMPHDVTEKSFDRFLCSSPFLPEEVEGSKEQWEALNTWIERWKRGTKLESPQRYGPTHECYYLDNRLIAISVLDFLPSGLSSIYFIWDPDFAHLSLGTLLGIREIQMCEELNLGYYYLGYYIEECPKMRYKAKFGGSLLDVCNEAYAPLERVRPFIEDGRFFALAQDHGISVDMSPDAEYEMEQSGLPVTWSGEIVNVGEKLFCSSKIYKDAQKASAILKAKYRVGVSEIPLVLPGTIPLVQILTWFEDKVIDLDLEVSLYEPMLGKMYECRFGELTERMRSVVIDFLRLFGLEKLQDSVILL